MPGKLAHEWLKSALADIKSMEHIGHDSFLTHMVAFHAQQCVEKSLKALLEHHEKTVPKEHSTIRLAGLCREIVAWSFDMDLLSDLDDLYIESRYPGDLGLMPHGKPSMEESREFCQFARALFERVCDYLRVTGSELAR